MITFIPIPATAGILTVIYSNTVQCNNKINIQKIMSKLTQTKNVQTEFPRRRKRPLQRQRRRIPSGAFRVRPVLVPSPPVLRPAPLPVSNVPAPHPVNAQAPLVQVVPEGRHEDAVDASESSVDSKNSTGSVTNSGVNCTISQNRLSA